MLKMALLDCAITEDGAFDSSRVPTAGNLPSTAKKNGNVRRGGGGGWLGAAGIDWRIRSMVSCSVQKKCLQRFVVIKSDANYQALKN